MALELLAPELAICARCLDEDDSETLVAPLRRSEDGALLVREVCASPNCVALQVLGHFCRRHARQRDACGGAAVPVRACHVCRTGALEVYRKELEMWFIMRADCDGSVLNVEVRHKAPPGGLAGQEQDRRERSNRKLSVWESRPRRRVQKQAHKELLRAREWSLGNIAIPKLLLWKDKPRPEPKVLSGTAVAAMADVAAGSTSKPPAVARYPDPTAVFCVVKGCQRFAKTGDRCRFHSDNPLVSMLLSQSIAAAPARATEEQAPPTAS